MNKPLTKGQAIKLTCYGCSAGEKADVKSCPVKSCALHAFRMGKKSPKAKGSMLSAIKQYYYELQGFSRSEVRDFPIGIPVDAWRTGVNPKEPVFDTPENRDEWFPWRVQEREDKLRRKKEAKEEG